MNHKYYLMLCELHHPNIHGKTITSYPSIETHYLVYDKYDPITTISYQHLNTYEEYYTDQEYDSDDDNSTQNYLAKINDDIRFLKNIYMDINLVNPHRFGEHPSIRNYYNIVCKTDYIKPEIGQVIVLPTQETVAILKTFWLRIIQRKWKRVFIERTNIMKQNMQLSHLSFKKTYPIKNKNIPGLKGMLFDIK
jgi:hypothetical protein